MAYTSLYRRYRPAKFDDVIGQDHIVRTLKNQIETNSIGHAYLFTGTRGTGKTSVAKIFAKAVNCEHPIDSSPCGECSVCRELAIAGNFDVLEIDAASNNSVDQIRELTDKIGFPPTVGKYKVYIIDEVHMLTKSAFNALLKTLEEPPAHAIFILATTEVHQIPATILSRCLRFDFRLVSSATLAKRIKFIFDDNGYKYENEAIAAIASAGQGSVRDALSVADMCVSYSDGNVTYSSVLEVLGASDPEKLACLAEYIADGNIESALKEVSDLCNLGKNIQILASDIANLFRNLLYIKTCSNARELLSIPDTVYAKYAEMAKKYSVAKCMSIMKIMNSLEGEFRYSTQHRILFEAAIVEAATTATPVDNNRVKELEQQIAVLDKKLQQLIKSGFKSTPVKTDAKQVWKTLASELDNRGYKILALSVLDADTELVGDEFRVSIGNETTYEFITSKQNRDIINEIFSSIDGKSRLVINEVKKIEEDKALPMLSELFGSKLEIK